MNGLRAGLLGAVAALVLATCDDFSTAAQEARCRAEAARCDGGTGGGGGGGTGGGSVGGGTGGGSVGGGTGGGSFGGGTGGGSFGGGTGGGTFVRRDGGPSLPDGPFIPSEFTLRAPDAGDDAWGSGVVAIGPSVGWLWTSSNQANTSTIEVLDSDGGVALKAVPFAGSEVAYAGNTLMGCGVRSVSGNLASFGSGSAPLQTAALGRDYARALFLWVDAGVTEGLLFSNGAGTGPVNVTSFSTNSLNGTARARGEFCTNGTVNDVAPSPAADFALVVVTGSGGGCVIDGGVDAGFGDSLVLKADQRGAVLAQRHVRGQAAVSIAADGVAWLVTSASSTTVVGRIDTTTLDSVGPTFTVTGSFGLAAAVATPSDVFVVGSMGSLTLSWDGGVLNRPSGSKTAVLQLDTQPALVHYGLLDTQNNFPNAAAWVDGRLVVSGNCWGTDGGVCDDGQGGQDSRAYLMGLNP